MSPTQFSTERLTIRDWVSDLDDPERRHVLEADLRRILTKPVLAHLPPPLQLDAQNDAIARWIEARRSESDVSLIRRSSDKAFIGLLILASVPQDQSPQMIHLGYLLGEDSWGKGYATELIVGLVSAVKHGGAVTLVGGVDKANPASARVLEKAGFSIDLEMSVQDTDMYVFRAPGNRI